VNVEKTKMMVFSKRKRKSAHIREIMRKANKVLGCIWGTGEKKWGGDFMRMLMFESMIDSILMYELKI
jgi:hypothetical protein